MGETCNLPGRTGPLTLWDSGPLASQGCAGPSPHLPVWDNDGRWTHRVGGELGAGEPCLGLWDREGSRGQVIVTWGLLHMLIKGDKFQLCFSVCLVGDSHAHKWH